ncbi:MULTISPECIES: hypothetical protein [unclassified Roseateles]|uniref:hypothetical protein n=1 Tax=unclassified Roseateles TaxID=2626991 RepID=UPI0006F1C507|nr:MULTISPECIES: hypothetical protein [unclassified Roseateles]KQW49652.1 hypothetical protein ASC81_25505 [Pelomonas sp. Root405]KRA76111.1 hypothetical protein ASD88_25455 [Pelomonas sp. Root662]
MTSGLAIATAVPEVQLGAGASLSALGQLGPADAGGFERALSSAMQRMDARAVEPPAAAMQRLVQPLEHINAEAASLGRDARAAAASGQALTPGELVNLTVRCQEFMFHCQLTSNIANRTSEGLQQLFRQQS